MFISFKYTSDEREQHLYGLIETNKQTNKQQKNKKTSGGQIKLTSYMGGVT